MVDHWPCLPCHDHQLYRPIRTRDHVASNECRSWSYRIAGVCFCENVENLLIFFAQYFAGACLVPKSSQQISQGATGHELLEDGPHCANDLIRECCHMIFEI